MGMMIDLEWLKARIAEKRARKLEFTLALRGYEEVSVSRCMWGIQKVVTKLDFVRSNVV